MKGKKLFSLVLSIFLLAGLVGAAAVLSKNFTEIPEFILSTNVEKTKHSGSNQTNNDQSLKETDLDHIIYNECEIYTSGSDNSTAAHWSLTQSQIRKDIFYTGIPTDDSIGRSGYWGLSCGFALDDGRIKYWNYGTDVDTSFYGIPATRTYEPLKQDNPGLFTLVCFSFFGDEPDLNKMPDVYSNYSLDKEIESEFDFKIFVYTSLEKQLKWDHLNIIGENQINNYSLEKTRNYYYSQDYDNACLFPETEFETINFSIELTKEFSDESQETYNWELNNINIDGFISVVVFYSPQVLPIKNSYHFIQRETLIDLISSETIGYVYIYGVTPLSEETSDSLVIESPGLYLISITRDDFLRIADQNGNVLLIDNDSNANRDNDVQFRLMSVKTKIDNQYYDTWDGGYDVQDQMEFDYLYGTSLEIHQDGTSLETQVTGKNDTGCGGWYIDGHITPPDRNYTLEIEIDIRRPGLQTYYTSVFSQHTELIQVSPSLNGKTFCKEGNVLKSFDMDSYFYNNDEISFFHYMENVSSSKKFGFIIDENEFFLNPDPNLNVSSGCDGWIVIYSASGIDYSQNFNNSPYYFGHYKDNDLESRDTSFYQLDNGGSLTFFTYKYKNGGYHWFG